jgi:hypothetical protein
LYIQVVRKEDLEQEIHCESTVSTYTPAYVHAFAFFANVPTKKYQEIFFTLELSLKRIYANGIQKYVIDYTLANI